MSKMKTLKMYKISKEKNITRFNIVKNVKKALRYNECRKGQWFIKKFSKKMDLPNITIEMNFYQKNIDIGKKFN